MPLTADTEDFVKFVTQYAVPKAMSVKETEHESAIDPVLKRVHASVLTGKWTKGEDKSFQIVKDELSVVGKLVLRGIRIVMSETLRSTTLKIAHEGHPGIVLMKHRLLTKVWWPGIDRNAEDVV